MNSKLGVTIINNYFAVLRPKQWIKNLLIAAAPFAAGIINEKLLEVFLGILIFCVASSFGYLLNDWHDRKYDNLHPKKKLRPFASGALKQIDFLVLTTSCFVLIIVLSQNLPNAFLVCVLAYLIITFSYTFFAKNLPIVEILWLSLGFLIRAIAGSALIGEPPTGWFVISVFFGSIFIVSTKRLAEKVAEHKSTTRQVLKTYSVNFLESVISASMGITLVTYSLWVFQIHSDSIIAQLSIVPLSLCLLTYAHLAEKSYGESPEDLFLGNATLVFSSLLIFLSLVWVSYFE